MVVRGKCVVTLAVATEDQVRQALLLQLRPTVVQVLLAQHG
jgi:hypothetical protein